MQFSIFFSVFSRAVDAGDVRGVRVRARGDGGRQPKRRVVAAVSRRFDARDDASGRQGDVISIRGVLLRTGVRVGYFLCVAHRRVVRLLGI